MIASAAVNTISWVPTIQQPISEFAIKWFPQIPRDTNWLAIISIVVFLGFVIWTIWDLSGKLESERPDITYDGPSKIGKTTEESIYFQLQFHNKGIKPAYQLTHWFGFAPEDKPQDFVTNLGVTSANPVMSGDKLECTITQKYNQHKGQNLLVYCVMKYSDSIRGGKRFKSEWWLYYKSKEDTLVHGTEQQKQSLIPHVTF